MTLELKPLSPAIGALVSGVDLAAPLDGSTHEALGTALVRHHVLFFESRALSPIEQRAFASRFGELHIHPIYRQVEGVPEIIVRDTDAGNVPDNDNWHTDV